MLAWIPEKVPRVFDASQVETGAAGTSLQGLFILGASVFARRVNSCYLRLYFSGMRRRQQTKKC